MESRVELHKGRQKLLLKRSDINVNRLCRVFKICPSGMYLEDDAQHAEFPGDNGAFTLTNNRYKVCGDEDNQSSSASSPPTPPPVWNTPISWQSQRGGRMPFPTNSHGKQLVGRPNYESAYFKRSIPLVSLSLNKTGKNIVIENPPDENVFVKVPESVLSVDAILAEVGKKTSLLPSDLVLLDSKVLVVSDDKEMDYWRTPSRKLCVAKATQFNDLSRKIARNRKQLSRSYRREEDDSDIEQMSRIESTLDSISDTLSSMARDTSHLTSHLKQQVIKHFECKICKSIPIPDSMVTTSCCNQLLGCRSCFMRATDENVSCPLCRNDEVAAFPLRGFDELLRTVAHPPNED